MTVSVYEAYLRAQLEIVHEEIVKLWKVYQQVPYMTKDLQNQIHAVVSMLPDQYRTFDMPKAKPYRQVAKPPADDFEDLLG